MDPNRISRDHPHVKTSLAVVLAMVLALPSRARAEDPPVEENHDDEWAAVEAADAPPPKPSPGPPPPSPELDRLQTRSDQGEKLAIAGYVVGSLGVIMLFAGLGPLVAGEIEEDKEENFFQEAGDPESARRKKRLGAGLMLTGLGVAAIGGTLVGVGLVRKKRAEDEMRRILTTPTASIAPWFGDRAGGLALSGRF